MDSTASRSHATGHAQIVGVGCSELLAWMWTFGTFQLFLSLPWAFPEIVHFVYIF
jgi:hypothetical protein